MKEGFLVKNKICNMTEYLKKNRIKPSFQRIKILEYLLNNKSHPTVDEIYKEVLKGIPTLSKTTVYNTLTLFIESNILKGLYIEDNEIRYDPILYNHGHFKCKKCEEIYDFFIDIDSFKSNELNDFQIHEKGVYFKGICPKCIVNKFN
jgi:Fur family peroxide stress response transcriptional regulator